MNKNYRSGRAFEYETMETWRERGYEVSRSAGSHSPVDVFAWRRDRKPEFIQCKKVKDQTTAIRLSSKFKLEALPSNSYHQVLTIKVKGTKLPITVTI
jgi:Holliday junction resolvase